MRTTLDIADDVLQAAKERAQRERKTVGEMISDLARRALTSAPEAHAVNEPDAIHGLRPFAPLASFGRSREHFRVDRLQQYQIALSCLASRRNRNPGVERDESSFMLNGKGEQVYVGQLPGAMDSRRVDKVRIQQADFI